MLMDKAITTYIDNKEYDSKNDLGGVPNRVYNPEGYADALTTTGPLYKYYRRDHLGNIREVWQPAYSVYIPSRNITLYYNATTLQRTQYYPSGLPLAANTGDNPGLQTKKYNGKEFIEMSGFDTYDYGARGYYAAIGRFMSVDPMAEKYSWQSSYCYAANNPLRYQDFFGLGPGDDIWDFLKGVGGGIASGAHGTVQFIKSDAWKGETWANTGNLLLGAALMQNGNVGSLYGVDAALGTNTAGAVQGVNQSIDNAVNTLATGTPTQKGEVVGSILYGVAEGVALSKGAGLVSDMAKGVKTVEGFQAAKGGVQYTKSSLALGREVHAGYKVAEHAPALGRFKEFTGIKGIRPDFVDFGTKTIYELKPFNPRGIQLGTKQLNNYKSLFEQNYGGTWKTVLDHY